MSINPIKNVANSRTEGAGAAMTPVKATASPMKVDVNLIFAGNR